MPIEMENVSRIGIVGTGFIARGLTFVLEKQKDLQVSKVLTRREISSCTEFPRKDALTNSVQELIDTSDVVVECSGDALHATEVIDQALTAARPVVTMDAEFHVTTGSYFVPRGLLTEAEGDQPGCLAALKEDALQMGFTPLVYGNIKGFLHHTPTLDDMKHWAEKQGISLEQVISFTDGTKIQMEQALVANGLGADIAAPGLLGIASEDVPTGANLLAEHAERLGCALSDYLLSPKSPAGVFIVATHEGHQQPYLKTFKFGEGPYYTLLRNFHFCHLEVPKTIRRVLRGGGVLLNNTESPRISVAAVAKRPLARGQIIRRGIGSFDVRGIAIRITEEPDHLPIGLLADAVIVRSLEPGQLIRFRDVEIPDSLAKQAWANIKERVLR
jgi:predicted homoserine dehydrogenase-like protein